MVHSFYIGHDNDQSFSLLRDGTPLTQEEYDAISRIALTLRPYRGNPNDVTVVDSQSSGAISWDAGEVVIEGSAFLELVDQGDYVCRVVVYSGDQPDGVVWLDYRDYVIEVRD